MIHALLREELEEEMAATRAALARVAGDKLSWKPHEKSMSLGRLAGHLAEMPAYFTVTLEKDIFDPSTSELGEPEIDDPAEILATFDGHLSRARSALAAADDASLLATWELRRGGLTVFSMPRITALRRFVLNHMIHHRGQLTVYFRLLGEAVPPIYGPSADEGRRPVPE